MADKYNEWFENSDMNKKNPYLSIRVFRILERERRLELPTPTLARLCSTN